MHSDRGRGRGPTRQPLDPNQRWRSLSRTPKQTRTSARVAPTPKTAKNGSGNTTRLHGELIDKHGTLVTREFVDSGPLGSFFPLLLRLLRPPGASAAADARAVPTAAAGLVLKYWKVVVKREDAWGGR